jgi:hypothetical protein
LCLKQHTIFKLVPIEACNTTHKIGVNKYSESNEKYEFIVFLKNGAKYPIIPNV